jgi:demethylmenaquinone methyltransferase/2-methoxy-6-polyprenyl-1,4-benzoquinol methylase
MNDLESFGLHRAWKRVLIERAAAVEPRDILDVATGTGDIALALAQRCPAARVVGFDFSEAMLAVAAKRHSSAVHPAPNLAFLRGNAMEMPFDDVSFDVVTISFGLRNMPDYQRVLSEMVRVLRPGGLLLCLEASYPTLPVVKQGFRVYFRHIMPLMGRLVTKRPDEYRWLNDSTEAFLAKPQLAQLMADCGLIDIHYRSYLLGSAALHSGLRAGCQ